MIAGGATVKLFKVLGAVPWLLPGLGAGAACARTGAGDSVCDSVPPADFSYAVRGIQTEG